MIFPPPHDTGAPARAADYELPSRRSGRTEELQSQVDRLMSRMRIAVIYGGDKSAGGAVINPTLNPRSWKSYQAVAEDIAASLARIGFHHVQLLPENMQLGERLRQDGIHMAWLNTGGVQGYNPMAHAAAMLEMLGIPYVGHDPLTVGMLDNKHVFKRELKALGIPTAPFVVSHFGSGRFRPGAHERFRETFSYYDGSFVVKPVSGRASLHVHLVEHAMDLSDVVAEVHKATQNHALIEAYLPGREFCIAACGLVTARKEKLVRHDEPFVFAAIERLLEPDEKIFTSMDVRPITVDRIRTVDPASDGMVLGQLQKLARQVFVELNLESVIRLDVREDAEGRMVVLEANPKPDLKAPSEDRTSLICANLSAYGMSYDDLILSLIADRLDLILSQRRQTVTHLTELLEAS